MKVSDAIKLESMSLSNVNTFCQITAAGQWNMVCQHNLLFGSYKFRDNAENGKFILLLNRNTGVTAAQETIILTGIKFFQSCY